MTKVSINGLRVFLHVHELKTNSRLTGHTGLIEVELETLLEIPGRGVADGEIENGLKEYTGDVANNELVLLIPLSMGGIGLGKSGSGGCGEGDGGFIRSHKVDLKERIGSNMGEGGNPRLHKGFELFMSAIDKFPEVMTD
ncbi:unnamed protein product [Prunus armeniaca]